MARGIRRRKVLFVAAPILSLLAVVAVLFVSGKLPIGVPSGAAEDDSTAASVAEGDEPEVVPVPVELARAQRRSIAAFYRSASVIEADRLVDLVAKVNGRVQAIHTEEGDWTEQGAVLAELENGREKIQLQQAELRLEDQERQCERSRQMLAEELISQQEFDSAEAAYLLAVTERDLARIALEETFIRAPFAGQVTDRMIVLGQQVAAATPVFTLADFDPLRVRVHLPEPVARKINPGQKVLVAPEAVDASLPARVERIAPVVDPNTSTVRVTLQLDDGLDQARVGGFCKVRITTDTHHDALAVPKTALVEEGGLRSLFVAEADTVRKVEVRTGLYDESHIEILDGLFGGEFVVTLGQGGLRTGSHIEALNGTEVGYAVPAESEADSDAVAADETLAALTEDR
jgi:membrane fusion protein (multidrug efflux system)